MRVVNTDLDETVRRLREAVDVITSLLQCARTAQPPTPLLEAAALDSLSDLTGLMRQVRQRAEMRTTALERSIKPPNAF